MTFAAKPTLVRSSKTARYAMQGCETTTGSESRGGNNTQARKLTCISSQLFHTQTHTHAYTGLVLWDAAYVLADLMERNVAIAEASWRNSRVLELGAGLGLPTLVAWLQGARVVATDGAERELALLRHNIAHAIPAEAVPPGVPPPAVLPLWWGDEAQSVAVQAQLSTPAHSSMEERSSPNGSTALQCRESPLFDIILCCECVYNAEAHEPLLAAWRRLGSTQATVLLVYKRRGLDEDAFATLLAAQADWRCRRLSPRLFHPDFAAASDIVVTVVRRVVEQ